MLGHIHATIITIVTQSIRVQGKLMPVVNHQQSIKTFIPTAAAPQFISGIDVIIFARRMKQLRAIIGIFVKETGHIIQVAVLFVVEKKGRVRLVRFQPWIEVDTFLDLVVEFTEQSNLGLHLWDSRLDAPFHKPSKSFAIGQLIFLRHLPIWRTATQGHLFGRPKVLRVFIVLRHAIPKVAVTA